MTDSDAILRHLEQHPDDRAAAGALADALAEEGRDEPFAFGVRWLVQKGLWLNPQRRHGSIMPFEIDISLFDWKIDRVPFNEPIFGSSVENVLRMFSLHLWGCRKWLLETAMAGDLLPRPRWGPAVPVPSPPVEEPWDTVPYRPIHPWRSEPWVPWTPSPYVDPGPPPPERPWRPWRRDDDLDPRWFKPATWIVTNGGRTDTNSGG